MKRWIRTAWLWLVAIGESVRAVLGAVRDWKRQTDALDALLGVLLPRMTPEEEARLKREAQQFYCWLLMATTKEQRERWLADETGRSFAVDLLRGIKAHDCRECGKFWPYLPQFMADPRHFNCACTMPEEERADPVAQAVRDWKREMAGLEAELEEEARLPIRRAVLSWRHAETLADLTTEGTESTEAGAEKPAPDPTVGLAEVQVYLTKEDREFLESKRPTPPWTGPAYVRTWKPRTDAVILDDAEGEVPAQFRAHRIEELVYPYTTSAKAAMDGEVDNVAEENINHRATEDTEQKGNAESGNFRATGGDSFDAQRQTDEPSGVSAMETASLQRRLRCPQNGERPCDALDCLTRPEQLRPPGTVRYCEFPGDWQDRQREISEKCRQRWLRIEADEKARAESINHRATEDTEQKGNAESGNGSATRGDLLATQRQADEPSGEEEV